MPAAVVKRERKSRPKAEGSNRRRTDPLSDSTDEEANEEKDQADNEKDIKPKLDGVEKEGIDFKYTNEPHGGWCSGTVVTALTGRPRPRTRRHRHHAAGEQGRRGAQD